MGAPQHWTPRQSGGGPDSEEWRHGRVGQAEGSAQVRGLAPPTGRTGRRPRLARSQPGREPDSIRWARAGGPRTPPSSALLRPGMLAALAGYGGAASRGPGRHPRPPRLRPGPRSRPRPDQPSGLRVAHSPVADHHALDGLHGRGPGGGGRGREPSCGEMPGAAAAADPSAERAAGDSRASPKAGRGDSRARPAGGGGERAEGARPRGWGAGPPELGQSGGSRDTPFSSVSRARGSPVVPRGAAQAAESPATWTQRRGPPALSALGDLPPCLWEPAGNSGFRSHPNPQTNTPAALRSLQELVSRLLHAHFKDDKTKVSGDSLQLMAELLKIFVVGEPRAQAPSQKQPSVRYGRPRQKMPFLWMWTSWRRCFRSCSWTSRDLSRG
ncbi:centromere protein X isoform X2 [Callithrix jacchus]